MLRYTSIIIVIMIIVFFGYMLYCSRQNETFTAEETYEQFYYKLQSKNIELQDKCRIAKQRLQDVEDGLKVDKNISDTARTFVNDYCLKTSKPPKTKKVDIDPKAPDALEQYYKRICLTEFGEQRDKVEFDEYDIYQDGEGNYYLDNERIDQIVPDSKKCRRLEEYVKNNPNGVGKNGDVSNQLEKLGIDCRLSYPNLDDFDRVGYNFYLSKDGKYYLNNEPIDKLKINKKNCIAIKDINGYESESEISFRNLSDHQKEVLCKRNNEMNYVCGQWDQKKLREWGKQNEIGINLNEYEVGDGVYEYSFLTPSEHYRVSRSIRNGKSGLNTEGEKAMCYRKMLMDNECNKI